MRTKKSRNEAVYYKGWTKDLENRQWCGPGEVRHISPSRGWTQPHPPMPAALHCLSQPWCIGCDVASEPLQTGLPGIQGVWGGGGGERGKWYKKKTKLRAVTGYNNQLFQIDTIHAFQNNENTTQHLCAATVRSMSTRKSWYAWSRVFTLWDYNISKSHTVKF